jgi:8-oxo-dGTP diphosphatase
MPRPTLAVGGIAVVGGRLLVIQRGKAPGMGLWSLPGGRVDSGETMRQAVVREMAEETSLVVECGELRGWVERIDGQFHTVIFDFDVMCVSEPGSAAAGDDAADLGWVTAHELSQLDLVPGMMAFLTDHNVISRLSMD